MSLYKNKETNEIVEAHRVCSPNIDLFESLGLNVWLKNHSDDKKIHCVSMEKDVFAFPNDYIIKVNDKWERYDSTSYNSIPFADVYKKLRINK